MGYKVETRIKVDLSELGDNGGTPFFANISNPQLLSYEEKLELGKFATAEGEELTPEMKIERARKMKDYVKRFVEAWNLIDRVTEVQVDPKNADAFERVPSSVVEKIIKKIGELLQPDEETKNSSPQLVKS